MRWKKASLGAPSASLAIITPNWLRVERAMIFFRSVSPNAVNPAINIVIEDEIRSKVLKSLNCSKKG